MKKQATEPKSKISPENQVRRELFTRIDNAKDIDELKVILKKIVRMVDNNNKKSKKKEG